MTSLAGRLDQMKRRLRERLLAPFARAPHLRKEVYRDLAARGHLILADCGEERFFVDPRDQGVGEQLLRFGTWQRDVLDRAIAALRAEGRLRGGGLFLEIGANIGTHTVYALKSGAFVRALALEPEPGNFALLVRNLAENGVAERARALRLAAGAVPGEARLELHPRNFGAHSIAQTPSADASDAVGVAVRPIADVLAAEGIAAGEVSLVWIDVEGAEPQVVAGLGPVLEARVPLVLEYTPERYAPAARHALDAALAAAHPRMLVLDRALATWAATADIAHRTDAADILFA